MKMDENMGTETVEEQAADQECETQEAEQESETQESAEKKETTKEDEDLQTKYMRLAADFQNFRRRTEKEKSDIYAYANEKIVAELLNVIDNFERAISHKDASSDKTLAEGMDMIFKQLTGVLEKSGVVEINAEGEDFDPNFHHAVMQESSGDHESGKVIAVLQKGYSLNGRVIRPAMVKVAE